jgi:putative hydrolase of the HAD superfamily
MIPKPEAIIFDLDDTLIMSDGTMESTWMEMCEVYSATHSAIKAETLFRAIRDVAEWYWSDESRHREGRTNLKQARRVIVRKGFEQLGVSQKDDADRLADSYSEKRLQSLELFEGVHELLADIQKLRIPLALLTNGEQHIQQAKIDRFNLEPYFDSIRIEGEVGFGKPEEKAYLETLKILGTSAADTWIVGDNLQWEVEIPKTLGFFTIWMNYYHRKIDGGHIVPDRVIQQIGEIRPLVEESYKRGDT